MHPHSFIHFRSLFLLPLLGLLCVQSSADLLRNGGFEEGETGWMYQQWEGKSLPGHLNREKMSEGLASFSMTGSEGQTGKRYMAVETVLEDPERPHTLSFDLKPQDLPADTARVRLQRVGKGLWHGPAGKPDLVRLGGSSEEWLSYRFVIPADDLKGVKKVRVFFYHDKVDQGTLMIDNVILRPAKAEETTQLPEEPEGAAAPAEAADGGLTNGGFENGLDGWMYQQWEGRDAPGRLIRENAPEGRAWFRYQAAAQKSGGYIAKEIPLPEDDGDLRIHFLMKTENVPEGAARVRLQVPGSGWLHTDAGYPDQVKTGGSADWKRVQIDLPAAKRGKKNSVTLFFFHDQPETGYIGIDDLKIGPVEDSGSSEALRPASGSLQGISYHPEQPCVLVPVDQARVAVRASPLRAVYRVGELPRVDVDWVAAEEGQLRWQVLDGFGTVISEGEETAGEAGSVQVALPVGHGYYEVVARLEQGGSVVGEARRSLGALRPAPPTDGDEPFGLWVQGRDLYPELGVRWVREGIHYGKFASDPEGFTKGMRDLFAFYRENDIKILAYPKGQPTEYKISRELMQDTPEAWAALEAHWTQVVTGFADQVDAWGVINEPMADFWEGSDEMIIRYWALMRRIVDEHDPGAPVIGPSVNPMTPRHIRQWEDLLKMGIADSLDAIEVHPYTLAPEDNQLVEATTRFQTMAGEIAGKPMDVWVTELGVSATHPRELWQAQFLMRSWLLAKEAGYPMLIWHMFSWPQGESQREVNFGTWRNDKAQQEPPQPRPAGLAYGVMTRQLAGAVYKNRLEYFGPSVRAYVFERREEAVLAIWTTGPEPLNVQVSASGDTVESVNLFGRRQELAVEEGRVSLRIDQSPLFLSPMPDHLLSARPLVDTAESVPAVPGEWTQTTLELSHPLDAAAELRVEWLVPDGWEIRSDAESWHLGAGESATSSLSMHPPLQAELGPYPVYGKIHLNGDYVAVAAVPVRVEAPVVLVDLVPSLHPDPAVKLVLRRMNPDVESVRISLADGDPPSDLRLDGNIREVYLPVKPAPAGTLKPVKAFAVSKGIESTRSEALSFVPAEHFPEPPEIDGSLEEWPTLSAVETAEESEPMALAWGWDAGHLYLAVRVTDAVHRQEQEPFATWQQDSLQIGLVPDQPDDLIRPPNPGLQEADYSEVAISLSGDTPGVFRHRTLNKHQAPEGPVPQSHLPLAIKRDGEHTVYELAFPLPALGVKSLEAGDVLRAALLVNDADEEGGGIERATRTWFDGIKKSKDPQTFGHLILRSPTR